MGQLLLKGHPPYTLAYNMKWPGAYFTYAFFIQIFGATPTGIHFGFLLMQLATILLVYAFALNFLNPLAAACAATATGLLSLSWHMLGQAGHATHLVTFFALLSLYLTSLANNPRPIFSSFRLNAIIKQNLLYFLSGTCMMFALLCKQSAIFFFLFQIFFLIFSPFTQPSTSNSNPTPTPIPTKTPTPNSIPTPTPTPFPTPTPTPTKTPTTPEYPTLHPFKRLLSYGCGVLFLSLLTLAYFLIFGNLSQLIFWTFSYLYHYGTQVPLKWVPDLFITSLGSITAHYSSEGYVGLFLLALIGIVMAIFYLLFRASKAARWVAFFFLCSFLTVIPGFYFRDHYYLSFLPALGLAIGFLVDRLPVTTLLFVFFAGIGLWTNRVFLFQDEPLYTCKSIYTKNPFAESPEIGTFIKNHTQENDQVAILGSEPQILFYANRQSPTGFIYTYSLMENHPYALDFQHQMAAEIEAKHPKFIVFVKVYASWLTRQESFPYLVNWADAYTSKNYHLVAAMSILPNQINNLSSYNELAYFKAQSSDLVYIFQSNN